MPPRLMKNAKGRTHRGGGRRMSAESEQKPRTHWRLRLPLRHEHRRHGGRGRGARLGGEDLGAEGVVISRDYKFMCSSLGQELIEKDIKELGLDARGRGGLLAAPA
ncbi:MAG: hypothetical protein MZV49_25335 [Rhodopseudomonas palustris]|nr:hypothetical protein [Rhodopseudomonas palustris]